MYWSNNTISYRTFYYIFIMACISLYVVDEVKKQDVEDMYGCF